MGWLMGCRLMPLAVAASQSRSSTCPALTDERLSFSAVQMNPMQGVRLINSESCLICSGPTSRNTTAS